MTYDKPCVLCQNTKHVYTGRTECSLGGFSQFTCTQCLNVVTRGYIDEESEAGKEMIANFKASKEGQNE